MKLEFKINKYYLVGYAIASKNKPFSAWKKLEEKIWQKYKDEPAYYFLNPKHINWTLEQIQIDFSGKNFQSVFKKHSLILKKIYQEVFKSKEFKKLYKETNDYLQLVKNQWRRNEKEALRIFRDISGIKIPKKIITVYITHPKLHNGKAFPNKNLIVWGHSEDWKNYSTVYLCHELMHILTWNKQKNYYLMHIIIELAIDEEFRIRLNKKGIYFKEKRKLVGHKNLLPLKKELLPYWKKYLAGRLGKDVLELKSLLDKKRKMRCF